jgi:periplasmic divalent cation tolerance protein
MTAELLEVRVSVPDEETGLRIARAAVDAGAAACVQCLGPMTSVFTWDGAVQTEREWLLLAKTTTGSLARLREVVVREHPYDVPELLAVPVAQALEAYAEWVRDQVADQR